MLRPTLPRLVPYALTLAVLTTGAPAWSAPFDRVPRGDVAYEVLRSLAARGLVDRPASEFTGDARYTRLEIARLLAPVLRQSREGGGALRLADEALLARLAREYEKELGLVGIRREELPGAPTLNGEDSGRAAFATGLLTPRVFEFSPFRGGRDSSADLIYRGSVFLPLGKEVLVAGSLSNDRRLWSDRPEAFDEIDNLFIRFQTRGGDWEFGQNNLFWGPGYYAGMLFSDNAPNFTRLQWSKEYKLGRLGRWRFTQFAGRVSQFGRSIWILGRRGETQISPRFGLSVQEGLRSVGLPDPQYALLLPFYTYVRIQNRQRGTSDFDNYLASISLDYRYTDRARAYGELLLDDYPAPFGLGRSPAPRRIGAVVGTEFSDLFGDGRTRLGLEYAFTDGGIFGGTYRSRTPLTDWYIDNLSMGHPMGNNRQGPLVRAEHRLGRAWGIAEFERETRKEAPAATPMRERIMLQGLYDARRDLAVGLRLDRLYFGGGGRRTRLQLLANFAF
jgi:hypothetical protein